MFAETIPLLTEALDKIHGVPFGRFIVGLSGTDDAINAALKFLDGQDVRVEVIGYVKRNSI